MWEVREVQIIPSHHQCFRCPIQTAIEELQLANDDTAWRVFCEPHSNKFFDILAEKLPNLRRLIFGMDIQHDKHWSGDPVEDLIAQVSPLYLLINGRHSQVLSFEHSAFLSQNHDIREHCRTQIHRTWRRAQQQGIQLFICYDKSMFSIHDTAKFWPI